MIVYVITCLINGKKYVGKSTRTLAIRWKEHRSEALRLRKDWALYWDMRKYGFDAFTIVCLGECDSQEKIAKKERRYIRELDAVASGYNVRVEGGGGGIKYNSRENTLSVEHKRKISESVLRRNAERRGDYVPVAPEPDGEVVPY